jgi:hypothetical protein
MPYFILAESRLLNAGKLNFFEFFAGSFGLIGFGKAFDDLFKDELGVGAVIHLQEGHPLAKQSIGNLVSLGIVLDDLVEF